jgi:hypothetical protein
MPLVDHAAREQAPSRTPTHEAPLRVVCLLAALALAPAAGHAQVYKCVDANGKTVYSQSSCPTGSRASTLKNAMPAAPAATVNGEAAKPASPKTAAELELDFRKRRQQQAEAGKKESEKLAQAREKEENCRAARVQLVSLESGIRQARLDEKGERYYLDDAQVEQEKARARRVVESACK